MKRNTFIVCCIAAFCWLLPASAFATVGHLKLLLDSTYTLDESMDGVTEDQYLMGGGLRLEFEIPYGFSAGLEYTYAAKSGDVLQDFETEFRMHSPKLMLQWRYGVREWFEPYILALFGADFDRLEIREEDWGRLKRVEANWKATAGAYLGAQFQLKRSWIESWGVWRDFSLGLFVEVGYVYHQPFAVNLKAEPNVDIDGAGADGRKLGDLDASGPALRGGVLWRF